MIDRKKLVKKHNPRLNAVDILSPLSIGNGDFAFTADITGLQSFNEVYDNEMPICTMSNWGWHTRPVNQDIYQYDKTELTPKYYDTNGRQVAYYTNRQEREKYDEIRQNPHKANLAKVGFVFLDRDRKRVTIDQITNINQELDLYTGILQSNYQVEGASCEVRTACDNRRDSIVVKAKSDLITEERMFVELRFPYPSHVKNGSDWNKPELHESEIKKIDECTYQIKRIIDREGYNVFVTSDCELEVIQTGKHTFKVAKVNKSNELEINVEFTNKDSQVLIDGKDTFQNSEKVWEEYWENGGIISLSKSTNTAANEMERRMILAQYLTAIQCSGSVPPAETGLTCNSWYGKFHLEMHFWHSAHFALFNRIDKLEKSMKWYQDILPEAQKLAASQGYEGARWPKMVAPDGIDSPSPIGPLLIWQQPHVILYCDWCYKVHKDKETLEKYKELVFESAKFMASFAVYDEVKDRYVLGPPVIPAQERHHAHETINPTFELEYWIYGLDTACKWCELLGIEAPAKWKEIIEKIAVPPVHKDVYIAQENCLETFEKVNNDHPSMLGAYGMLNSQRINPKIMSNTLDRVLNEWKFETLWGWDFPIIAMTAARLGRQQDAVEILLKETPKNVYLTNGHNRQVLRSDLPLYLPGNGGFLLALAMMVTGYEGSSEDNPGFPKDGSWNIEYEDMNVFM